jgi:enoyl-CoA hydratase
MPNWCTSGHVLADIQGRMGFITLNRARALNALSLPMVRDLTRVLQAWRDDPAVLAVAIRGMGRDGAGAEQPFGAFCAGGDIRFFHAAALAGDPDLDAFFTEEYRLNHLVHTYPKPYIAFMDGIVMGGGMGISQGASLRIVTERTKMAMPETGIGLFPDVGGGFFLSRCPGHLGEYLALTGQVIGATDAVAASLADGAIPSGQLASLWDKLATTPFESANAIEHYVATKFIARHDPPALTRGQIDPFFSLGTVPAIVAALDQAGQQPSGAWAADTAALLRRRSPLMLSVVLEQIRRARSMGLAGDLRMERDLVHHCFHLRPGAASDTVEGIRALAIDKDHAPRWNPARLEDVLPEAVAAFFASPWAPDQHPLQGLS